MILGHSPLFESDKKITIFGETMENIDVAKLDSLVEKISKNISLEDLLEKEEIKYEQGKEVIQNNESKNNLYFPLIVDGSFKESINFFLIKINV